MDNEQTDPAGRSKPFYDGQGYLRIPGDDYYDKDGCLHKMGPADEMAEDTQDTPDPEKKHKTKSVTEIKIVVTLKSES